MEYIQTQLNYKSDKWSSPNTDVELYKRNIILILPIMLFILLA